MALRRFRDTGGPVKRTRVNHLIRITPVRVIGPEGEQVGVIETADAIRMADEAGLDLVEVSPEARPPVCKIMDYGKYKYELTKKEQRTRASSKQTEMKEIRLGRSVKIDPHDVGIRVDQARRFLMAGHKVQFTQRFRGREIAHNSLGTDRLKQIAEALSDISKIEVPGRVQGRAAQMILAPDKPKVDAVKRRLAKEAAQKAKEAGAEDPSKTKDEPETTTDAQTVENEAVETEASRNES